jgi:hypothetical protein
VGEKAAKHKKNSMLNIIVVVLYLARLSLSNLGVRVKFIVESVLASAYFGIPFPALLDITNARLALANAITVAKLNPTKENKKKVKDRKRDLMDLMELLRQYVQGIARANPLFAENIAFAAGMTLQNFPGRTAQTYGAMNTAVLGTVALLALVNTANLYHWQMTLTPDDASSWDTIAFTNKADFMKTGLASVKKYYFRVGNGGAVESEVFCVPFFIVVQ